MRLLLDSHAILWFFDGNPALSQAAREAIADGNNDVFLSPASLWELAIKVSLGKLRPAVPLREMLKSYTDHGAGILVITAEHAIAVETIPFHHRDPFDRLLAVQAACERLTLVSKDEIFAKYGIACLW